MKKTGLIGDKQFYKMVIAITLPMVLQNFITNLVSLLDNFMVGKLGTEEMSGVAIANQILLIVNLAFFGALSGIGIYSAQFYGKGNHDGLRQSLRFKIYVGLGLAAIACTIIFLFREFFIGLFLHDEDVGNAQLTLEYASKYILIMLVGLIPFAMAQALATTLRETGNTVWPMIASFVAVGTNGILNYILIFGKLGCQRLGVDGAAIATVISRFAEVLILIIYVSVKKEKFPFIQGLFKSFRVAREYIPSFSSKGGFLMLNETLWSGSQVALSIAYSLHGLDVVAAFSISSTVVNLFFIACMSLGVSTGIVVGKELGAGNHDRAVQYAKQMMAFSVFVCIFTSILLALLGGQVPRFYNTSDESKRLAAYFISMAALFMPADAICNCAYFILRSGGKTGITVIFDAGTLWILSVPCSFAMFYLWHADIMVVYPVVLALHLIKAVVGLCMVRSKIWVNTIV